MLVAVLASLGAVTGSVELFTWSATAFATKVVLVHTSTARMITAKMASVATPISTSSGAWGAKSAKVTWEPFSIRQYPKICLKMELTRGRICRRSSTP